MLRAWTPLLVATLVAATSAIAPNAADRPWRVIRGHNVEVFGQQSPSTLRDIAIQIEQFRVVLGRALGGALQPQSLPTEVYVFDTAAAMRPYVPLYHGKPAPLAGYCHCGAPDEVSVILASRSRFDESTAIVYHEYTHLLMRNALGDMPVWLNEGLAEFFSTFTLDGKRREAEVGAAIPRHVAALREEFIPLAQLLAVDRNSPLYNESTRKSIFYAEAWALTHYLLAGRAGGGETLNAFLRDYVGGAESGAALAKALGVPVNRIERDLRGYVNQPLNLAIARGFGAMTIALTEPVIVEPPASARTLAPADAEARLGEILLRVGRTDEARRRIEAAAAVRPPEAQALFVLAKMRLSEERGADATKLLEQAAAKAPDDFSTQYLYGLTLLRGLGDLSDSRWPSERALLAREALARAVSARPDSAAALAWLGYADQESGTHLVEAREVTGQAAALAPGRLDYVLQLAEIEAQIGNGADARRMLTPLARATDHSIAQRAATVLEMLDRAARPAASPAPSRSQDQVPRDTLDLRGLHYRLRETRDGEQRVFGELLEIACGAAGVRFRLRTPAGEIAAPARRMEEVEMTAFGDRNGQTVVCGPRVPADKVYVTRGRDGSVIAVEFMPNDYVP